MLIPFVFRSKLLPLVKVILRSLIHRCIDLARWNRNISVDIFSVVALLFVFVLCRYYFLISHTQHYLDKKFPP